MHAASVPGSHVVIRAVSAQAAGGFSRAFLWAPTLNVVYNGVIIGLQGFRVRGPY